jgi:isoleucyl-tRNA synthetase
MRELVRVTQNARKKAGLNVEDRIHLRLESDSKEVNEAISRFKDTIYAETLCTAELKGNADYSETVKVENQEVKILLSRASG